MNARVTDWRRYTTTLGLALHMQRAMMDLVEAAHTGDADVLLERAGELAQMLRQMCGDFGRRPEPLEQQFPTRPQKLRALADLCRLLGVPVPYELREPPC